jgi:type I restriction enzyme R subunit
VDAVSRRLELLKLEGLGFSRAEIVKELSVKCACSCRTVYNDFENVPFNQKGGAIKAYQLFGQELNKIIEELNTVLTK